MLEQRPTGEATARVPVLLPVALDQTYDYVLPPGLEVAPGAFVLVPFGAQMRIGIVGDAPWGPPAKPLAPGKLKAVAALFGEVPPLPDLSRRYAEWLGSYTLAPLGMVVRMMLGPALLFERTKP